jgi:hypothetical protein
VFFLFLICLSSFVIHTQLRGSEQFLFSYRFQSRELARCFGCKNQVAPTTESIISEIREGSTALWLEKKVVVAPIKFPFRQMNILAIITDTEIGATTIS